MAASLNRSSLFSVDSLSHGVEQLKKELQDECGRFGRLARQFQAEAKKAIELADDHLLTLESLVQEFLALLNTYYKTIDAKFSWLVTLATNESKMTEFVDRLEDVELWYIKEGGRWLCSVYHDKIKTFLKSVPPPRYSFESPAGMDFYILKSCISNFPVNTLQDITLREFRSIRYIAKRIGNL